MIVAEFYSSDVGLGYLMQFQVANNETTLAFGSIVYMTVLGLLVYGAVILIERLVIPSHMIKTT